MQVIRDPASTAKIANPEIRRLVEQRIDDLGKEPSDLGKEPFDLATLGYFLIVEPGDTLDAVDAQLGFPILANRFSGIRFGHPGFTPSFELVESFSGCFDMVFILDDSGYGIEVFIPSEGVDPDLLAMCKRYAMPAGGDAISSGV